MSHPDHPVAGGAPVDPAPPIDPEPSLGRGTTATGVIARCGARVDPGAATPTRALALGDATTAGALVGAGVAARAGRFDGLGVGRGVDRGVGRPWPVRRRLRGGLGVGLGVGRGSAPGSASVSALGWPSAPGSAWATAWERRVILTVPTVRVPVAGDTPRAEVDSWVPGGRVPDQLKVTPCFQSEPAVFVIVRAAPPTSTRTHCGGEPSSSR